MCAVPDRAFIHLDRRLTRGETKDIAVAEVKDAIKRAGVEAEVEVLKYAVPSYTNFTYETEKYFPTWVLEEEHVVCKSSVETFEKLFGQKARVDKWTFSTNGIATMGMMGIPTIGFGPANEIHAHSVDDQCPVEHLVKALPSCRIPDNLLSKSLIYLKLRRGVMNPDFSRTLPSKSLDCFWRNALDVRGPNLHQKEEFIVNAEVWNKSWIF